MHKIHISDLRWEEQRSPAKRFQSSCRSISLALGGARNVGTWGGGHPFDLQIRRIPPGATVCPFHLHLVQWELFVVLAGTGTVRAGSETHTVETGEVFVHPPGEPHQLTNSGATDLEVLIVADNPPLDACYYPDSNKWGLRPPGKFFRMTEVGYFEDEEPEVPGAAPYQPSGSAAAADLAPFARRKLHPDTLTWELYDSPKKKFCGYSKELSAALGAKRNAPTGLGGHPFDLELQKLPPGKSGCPFHIHSAQWELYYILSGTATARINHETLTLRPGDVVLHPPGEAHQMTNASATEDLVMYVVADNPPVDYWQYPDSGKWGVREPRKIFRMSEADYWDGEE